MKSIWLAFMALMVFGSVAHAQSATPVEADKAQADRPAASAPGSWAKPVKKKSVDLTRHHKRKGKAASARSSAASQ